MTVATRTVALSVAREGRMSFLPVLFGDDYPQAEASVYGYACKYIRDYDGAEWAFNLLADGAGYLSPCDGRVTLFNADNGFEGVMSGDAAGIVVTALVLNHRSWMHSHHDNREACRHYVHRYEQLMAHVATHREAAAIYRALD